MACHVQAAIGCLYLPPRPTTSPRAPACICTTGTASSNSINLEDECTSYERRRRRSKSSRARVAAAAKKDKGRADVSISVGTSGPTTVPILLPKEEYASELHSPVDGFEPAGEQALTLSEFLKVDSNIFHGRDFPALKRSDDDAVLSATNCTSQFWDYTSWVREDSPEADGGQRPEDFVPKRGKLRYLQYEEEAQCLSKENSERNDPAYDVRIRSTESTMVLDAEIKLRRRTDGAITVGDDCRVKQIYSHTLSPRNGSISYEEEHPFWNKSNESKGWAEGEEDREKRGVPAVMRCFDRTKIYVKAGDGGNGVVAFRREKFVPYGGPSGGSGGTGGNVYIEVDASMNSLLSFRKKVHFRAGRGSHGQGKGREGSKGEDCIVWVPPGTVVKAVSPDSSQSEAVVLLGMTSPGERRLLLPGGRGGRGNSAFKTGHNKAPQLAENGEAGAEMWVELELKLLADVGIIGVPNAGKSTLLSSISSARPNIADYPFTTLLPNLGVVSLDFDASMVVADLPGLLEGAHTGKGLGHEFLRHAERCRVLVHVVDGSSPQPQHEYEAVRLELDLFNPSLALKPCVVAFNKMDMAEVSTCWKDFEAYMQSRGIITLAISAATKQGTSDLVHVVYDLLKSEQMSSCASNISGKEKNDIDVGEMVRLSQNAPLEEFWVTCNQHNRIWQIHGAGLERFAQMTNWEYFEAARRFQRVLDASGVSAALKSQGIREGETVFVGKMEFTWHDSEDLMSLKDWKRGSRGSKLWPH